MKDFRFKLDIAIRNKFLKKFISFIFKYKYIKLKYSLFGIKTSINREDLEHILRFHVGVKDNLNCFDTSQITDMSFLFQNELIDDSRPDIYFNGDISEWDVSNVVDMEGMFAYNKYFIGNIVYGSVLYSTLENWNVSNVKNMKNMFKKSVFNSLIEEWDVRNVETMNSMFYGSKFNQELRYWEPYNVIDMCSMFESSRFNRNLKIPTKNVVYMDRMFYKCEIDSYVEIKINTSNVNLMFALSDMDRVKHYKYLPIFLSEKDVLKAFNHQNQELLSYIKIKYSTVVDDDILTEDLRILLG